jgi:hypothetical protein
MGLYLDYSTTKPAKRQIRFSLRLSGADIAIRFRHSSQSAISKGVSSLRLVKAFCKPDV